MNRHSQRKANTHQSLIDAARDLITTQGYDNVDILDITERANVSKATFYKHFINKEECVRELMQQGFDALAQQLFVQRQMADSAETWAIESFTDAFTWAANHRELLLIMVGGAASSRLNAFGRQYMVNISTRIMNEYRLPDAPSAYSPDIIAQTVTGLMIQFLGWWLETPNTYSAQQIAELVYRLSVDGLRTERP